MWEISNIEHIEFRLILSCVFQIGKLHLKREISFFERANMNPTKDL